MGRITCITSGKGGVGKSTVSLQLGVALAAKGEKVLVIELDNGLQSLDIMAGCNDKAVYHLGDVLNKNCLPSQAIYECSYQKSLYILPSSNSPVDITIEELSALCVQIAKFFTVILLDTPAGIGNSFEVASRVSDDSIIIVTADPISVRDACTVSNLLDRAGVNRQRLLINKVNTKSMSQNYYTDLDEIIDTVKAQLIGVIPDSFEIIKAISSGQALPEKSMPKEIFRRMADRYLGRYQPLVVQ